MRHSEILSSAEVQIPEVAEQELQIADLTLIYRTIANERTTVDVDFQQEILPEVHPLEERHDGFSGDDDNASEHQRPLSHDDEVFLVDKWYIQINFPMAFLEFARQRLGLDVNNPEEGACLLCKRDGWKPQGYPEGLLTVLQHDVQLCLELL
jgi:hypothetical protein